MRCAAARSSPSKLPMRTAILTALLVLTVPELGSAAEPLQLNRGPAMLTRSGDGAFVEVRELRLAAPGNDEMPSAYELALQLSMPNPSWSRAPGEAPDFRFSPDVALEGTSLTLRLVPTRHAPDPDEPLVLLPRLAGVGSRWFGLDFAAWF